MIQIIDVGSGRTGAAFVCDHCKTPINDLDSGSAMWAYSGSTPMHAHKDKCQYPIEEHLGGNCMTFGLSEHAIQLLANGGMLTDNASVGKKFKDAVQRTTILGSIV